MKTKLLAILLVTFTWWGQSNKPEGWHIFSEVTFYPKYFEEAGEELVTPKFDDVLKSLEGKEVELSGFHIPFDMDSAIAISALPYSSCFFCGGAGPETIAEVNIYPVPKLAPDKYVKVKGRLKLNDWDLNHMNFILEDAQIVK